MSYMLYVNRKPTDAFESLELAKSSAQQYIDKAEQVRIESLVAPAPSQAWYWDAEVNAWVHQPNAASEAS
ncbi:MAG: hypothetical protein Q8L95_09440 [Burkholderiales bacterium]|nr:hypothetical protein [Burkholderiales bacterium]